MEQGKPSSIRTTGIGLMIFSIFIIISNTGGAFAFTMMMSDLSENNTLESGPSGIDSIDFIFQNYITLCLTMVTIGISYFIGAFYLIRFKLWANILISIVSVFLALVMWSLPIMFILIASTIDVEGVIMFGIVGILSAATWSAPIIMLIWYLNKKDIKRHFN